MQVPIIVVGDVAGRYVSGIESQRGRVSVVRHVQDLGEMLGVAQSGIARAVLLVTQYEDLTQSMLGALEDLDVAVCAVTDGAQPLPFSQVVTVDSLADIKEVLTALEGAAQALENGQGPVAPASGQQPQFPQAPLAGAENQQGAVSPGAGASSAASPGGYGVISGEQDAFSPYLPPAPVQKEGKILTVWGPQGSPGRSTLALNLAGAFADQGWRVCLLDADTYGASVGALLGLSDDYSSLAQLCHYADRRTLTQETLGELVTSIRHRAVSLDVVTGLNRTDRWPEVRGKALAEVLRVLRQNYDLVVIDTSFCLEQDENIAFDGLAPLRNDATLTSIYEADRIVAVGAADVVGVPRAIKGLEALNSLLASTMLDIPVNVLFNRVRSEAIGGSATVALGHAWQRFGPSEPISWFLTEDRAAVDKSWLAGKTVFEVAPKSSLAREVEALATDLARLLGLENPAPETPVGLAGVGVVEKKRKGLLARRKTV